MEKRLPGLVVAGLLMLVLLVFTLVQAAPKTLGQSSTPTAPDYQLLTNSSMEAYDPAYGQYEGVDCQVASGWQRFWQGGPEPCFMDTRVFANSHLGTGHVEARDGSTSQLIVATLPYTAGLWQQVTGLTPGVGYGFRGPMLTIYQTSAQPPVHDTMLKQVGIDPTGGTDPGAPTVAWSKPGVEDQAWDVERRMAVVAEASTMTVFLRVASPYESGDPSLLNLSFLDWAVLAETPVVTATSPAVSGVPTFSVSWNNAKPAPGGDIVKYDVQWLDEDEGVWHGWITKTRDLLAAPFVGDRGHTYRFRARAWERYGNHRLFGPYRPDGDTRTTVEGAMLVGRVLSHEGRPIAGATVAVSGTTYAAVSGVRGRFMLALPPLAGSQTITVGHQTWLPPAPVYGVTFGLTETVPLTWTLRPPDDAVVNGQFEAGLDGWSLISEQGVEPTVVADPVHTGHGALELGSPAPASGAVGVSQTLVVSGAWEPALSLWYRSELVDAEDVFNVIVSVVTRTELAPVQTTVTRVFTPALTAGDWRHQWYSVGPPDTALTGTVTIRLQVWQDGDGEATMIAVDEVSLGATPGGPHKRYLPLVLKQF